MMKLRPVYFTALLMLVTLISSSFVVLMDSEDPGQSVNAAPTRVAGEDLEIENMTYTVSYLTGAEEWDTVWIWDDATLIIEGSTLRAKKVICRGDTTNTSFKMMGHDGTQALLSVTEGIVNIKADEINITGSRITVTNGSATIANGEDGGDGEISLFSRKSDLSIVDSELNVRAHDGGLGENAKFGGDGGEAYISVSANISRKNNVMISGTDIFVEGGQGGNGYVPNSGAGAGGNAELDISGHSTSISKSNLFTKGGKAGAHGEANPGEYGGNSKMNINSVYDANIYSAEMESVVGINTNLDQPRQSFILIKSKDRKIFWDHQKPDQEKMIVVSNVTANTVNIDSKLGSELHQVNTGDEPPQPLGNGVMKLFWWAQITVKDALNNEPLRDSSITYTVDPDPLPYPRDGSLLTTDENGKIDIEVIARENQDWKKHTFVAEILGGATGSSDQYRFDQNSNEFIPIEITRMTMAIVEPDLSRVLGGEFRFHGTALPGNERNEMLNITLYLDDVVIGYAEDISDEGAPAFSLWEMVWDSDDIPNGIYTLSIVGTDSAYQVRFDKTISINHGVVNHPPILDLVIIGDSTTSSDLEPGESADIHVNQAESIISFDVEIYERDMLSEFLTLGRKLVKSTMDIIHVPTGAVVMDDKVIGEDDIEKINLTGGYGYSFEIDANKRPGTDEPYREGEYKVTFRLEDDAGLLSAEVKYVSFNLVFDFYPKIVIYMDGTPALRPAIDREFPEESFVVSTDESHIFTAKFNFTDSSDRDDPLWSSDPTQDRSWTNLRFTFEVMDSEGKREVVFGPDQKGAGFSYDFDVTDIPSGEQGIFTLMISCKDSEGLESELRLKVRVTHNPPPEDLNVFGQNWGIPFGVISYVFLVIFVLMLGAYLATFMMIQRKNLNDKDSKMALLEKKKKEEDKEKGSSAIEDEFTGGRTQDASDYLKKSGGDKGKDDFAKELEAAQAKGKVQGGALPEQKPPEVKPPEPPKPQQAPQAPQQQPPSPTPPPVQQPPAAPAAPQQQPRAPPAPVAPRPPAPIVPPAAPPQPAAPVAPPQQAPPTIQPPAAPVPPKPPQPQQ